MCVTRALAILMVCALGACQENRGEDDPSLAVAPEKVRLPADPERRPFISRVVFDSGWQQTDGRAPKRYRMRIYASNSAGKQALVIYGHLGGADGARFPAPELADAAQERSDFEDSDELIDLRAGFAWVRFAPPPARAGTAAPPPARNARPVAWRLFSTYSLFVDPVGTEFVVATSTKSRFDVVCVTTPGAVEISQRYVPGSPRVAVKLDQLARRGGAGEPTYSVEDVASAGPRRDTAADVIELARLAIDQYNRLPGEARPTPRLNPPASLPPER